MAPRLCFIEVICVIRVQGDVLVQMVCQEKEDPSVQMGEPEIKDLKVKR
jgi:hypothetical protein